MGGCVRAKALNLVRLSAAFSVLKSKHKLALFDLDPELSPRTIGTLMTQNGIRKRTAENFCALIKDHLSNNLDCNQPPTKQKNTISTSILAQE